MHKKIILSLLILAFGFNTTQAQHRRDSERAQYEREYEAKKKELQVLRQKMEREEKEDKEYTRKKMNYGRNFIRFSPIKFLDLSAAGLGLEYEYLFGKSKRFGVNIPVTVMFKQNRIPNTNGSSEEMRYTPYFFINPGLKIYPSGQKRVTFATGPSLMIGYGKHKEWSVINTPTSSYTQYLERDNFRFGLIIMNYLNFQFTPEFSMHIDAGIGIRYVNHYTDPDFSDDITPTGQFSLGFGYRF